MGLVIKGKALSSFVIFPGTMAGVVSSVSP